MTLDFLVEEPSMEAFLRATLKTMDVVVPCDIHLFQGKQDMLRKLPNRLRSYRRWIRAGYYVIILLGCDHDDCHKLKRRIEKLALSAGLATKAQPRSDGQFEVVTRIAIEELEAWYLGDIPALRKAFPRLPEGLARRAAFRTPDAIKGGTWERLERLLQDAEYYPGGFAKADLARRVAPHMALDRNRSRSLRVFWSAVSDLVQSSAAAKPASQGNS